MSQHRFGLSLQFRLCLDSRDVQYIFEVHSSSYAFQNILLTGDPKGLFHLKAPTLVRYVSLEKVFAQQGNL